MNLRTCISTVLSALASVEEERSRTLNQVTDELLKALAEFIRNKWVIEGFFFFHAEEKHVNSLHCVYDSAFLFFSFSFFFSFVLEK